uniref:Uncharacterized protein n=1 Tax=Bracon brevicornis TaxID=1563983 RepID=A0A6V7JK31_9HYME
MKRFNVIILLALVAVASAGTLNPRQSESTQAPKKTENYETTGYIGKSRDLPPSQHQYPTYPDYSQYNTHFQRQPDFVYPTAVVPARQSPLSWSSTIASGLVPLGSFALTYGARAVLLVFQFIVLTIIGVILTTSICTFTPFCTITFDGFSLNKYQVKEQVSELARAYATPENLNTLTILVKTAMRTYLEMNEQLEKERLQKEKVEQDRLEQLMMQQQQDNAERMRGDMPEKRRRRR